MTNTKQKNLRLTIYMERNPECRGALAHDTIDVPLDMDIKDILEQIGAKGLTPDWGKNVNSEKRIILTNGHLKPNTVYLLKSPHYSQFEGYRRKFEQFKKRYDIDRPTFPKTNFILPEGVSLKEAYSKLEDAVLKVVEELHE